jgi:hypothetical protein
MEAILQVNRHQDTITTDISFNDEKPTDPDDTKTINIDLQYRQYGKENISPELQCYHKQHQQNSIKTNHPDKYTNQVINFNILNTKKISEALHNSAKYGGNAKSARSTNMEKLIEVNSHQDTFTQKDEKQYSTSLPVQNNHSRVPGKNNQKLRRKLEINEIPVLKNYKPA